MKKIIVSILLLAAMLLNVVALASCNNGGKPNVGDLEDELDKAGYQIPEGGFDTSKPVTITFYHTMSATKLQPILDLYIEKFNELYPNIEIVHSAVGGYDDVSDQIATEIAGGNQPNIAYCYPDHVATYNTARSVVQLNNLINSTIKVTDAKGNETVLGFTEEQIKDFVPGYYKEGAVYDDKGTMYTIPMSKSTEALYYNKDFFKENNLKVPTTWDEMEDVLAQIKEIDPNSIPLGYDSESNWFITMCEQLNSGYTTQDASNRFTFDNEANREFVKRFAEWYRNGWVTTEALYGTYTSGLFTNVQAVNGVVQKAYMVIGSTGGASYQTPAEDGNGGYLFETGIASIPQANPDSPKVISQGPSLCIFKDSDPQKVLASWLFVKFLSTDIGFQTAFSMASGYAPVIQSARNDEIYTEWLESANGYDNVSAMAVELAIDQVNAYYVSPAFNGSSVARTQVGLIMSDVFGYKGDLDTIIDQKFKYAMEQCNYSLKN